MKVWERGTHQLNSYDFTINFGNKGWAGMFPEDFRNMAGVHYPSQTSCKNETIHISSEIRIFLSDSICTVQIKSRNDRWTVRETIGGIYTQLHVTGK